MEKKRYTLVETDKDGKKHRRQISVNSNVPGWIAYQRLLNSIGIYYDPLKHAYYDTHSCQYMEMEITQK